MQKSTSFYCFIFLLFIGNTCLGAAPTNSDPIHGLVQRIVPAYENRLLFEKIPPDSGRDVFELEAFKGKIIIRGNNFNSMAVGLNYYLKYYCCTSVSWYRHDPVNLPVIMPGVSQKIRQVARVKNRFFLNYCTFGYTMPWWNWNDWERLIDWMALNGINLPLSITGQEAIWYKVWKKFGLTGKQIRDYFTGPAYLPWHRMSNIDHWDGPLPESWLNNQLELQKKIVFREREMNMIPVLPAFAGHVPAAIKTKFPNAFITRLGSWGGFSEKYQSNFLDPFDPLFKKIQRSFLEEQTKAFGTDHVYGADPFNEVTPPSWEPAYLADVSKTLFNSIKEVDSSAVWLQMSWLFYIDRDKWTNERIQSFVRAVPQDKMILLDYFCENTEVWKLTHSFFQQPYLWCYLGNFGGNTMLAGNLEEVEKRMENALNNGGENLWGIGSTLEGFDMNPLMYEYVFEKAWSKGPVNVKGWLSNWSAGRIGKKDENEKAGWELLLNTAYTSPTALGQATLTNARPSFTGHGNWTTDPTIAYQNSGLLKAWGLLLKVPNPARDAYAFDVVNIGRQVLGNYFSILRDRFTSDYNLHDVAALKTDRQQMLGLLDDMDKLLGTQSAFLLGRWLKQAKEFGINEKEKRYYEHDARNIITTWGGKAQSLNDYANRSWAGLMRSYYRERWKMFIDEAIAATINKRTFDEKRFHDRITNFEVEWTYKNDVYADKPSGDGVQIAKSLYAKYAPLIEASTLTNK
jgi:alpha-N-acetylglucosaminidase